MICFYFRFYTQSAHRSFTGLAYIVRKLVLAHRKALVNDFYIIVFDKSITQLLICHVFPFN